MSRHHEHRQTVSLALTDARRAVAVPLGTVVILLAGAALWAVSAAFPAQMPAWAPWEFSPVVYAGTVFPLFWYARGLRLTAAPERPPAWRSAAFVLGLLLIWTVLETRYLYLSQHAFFLNRIQHLVMHHLAPFLIALSWPGAVLARGAPALVRRTCQTLPVRVVLRITQNPVAAGVLFTGLIAFWLAPVIHFPAMLSPPLYAVMNWSMIIDGLLFFFLILDPRPSPPASSSYPARLLTVLLVEFPQILIGSRLTFTTQNLYPSYDLCGRLFPSIDPVIDQHIGGIVIWIPAAMMSAIAFLLVMDNLRRHEDDTAASRTDDIDAGAALASSSSWTGRR